MEKSPANPSDATSAKAAAQDAEDAQARFEAAWIADFREIEDLTRAATIGPPSARQVPLCHRSERPPRARAPHAGWMTVQAGLLTCGSMLCFRLPGQRDAQWLSGKELTAYSCGRSCGFGEASPHSHLAGLATSEPERSHHQGNTGPVNAIRHISYLEPIQMGWPMGWRGIQTTPGREILQGDFIAL